MKITGFGHKMIRYTGQKTSNGNGSFNNSDMQ